jgi:hypothetical protein
VSRARALTALALALAASVASGCGSDKGDRQPVGEVQWVKPPVLVRPSTLPNDRILSGILRNDGRTRADFVAKNLRLLDASGKRIPASPVFLQTFAHSMFPPTREPGNKEPIFETLRLGKIARVLPGKSVPLTISWHQPKGDAPVRIEWTGGSIPVPEDSHAVSGSDGP